MERIKFIELTQGQYAIVDEDMFEELNKRTWGAHSQGYALTSLSGGGGRKVFMHRIIMRCKHEERIDHINGDVTDNRVCNLRICNHQENAQNRKIGKNNTSGYKGVSWCKKQKGWRARLYPKSGSVFAGIYNDKVSAAKAYDAAAKKLFGKFAKLNFPEETSCD